MSCSVSGCDKNIYNVSLGLCAGHYRRNLKYGNPMSGGTSHGEPGKYLEQIVIPYSGDDCLVWPFARASNGYAQIHIGNRKRLTHRVVCERRHGKPPTEDHEASHSCGKGHEGCVNPNHLDWKTHLQNIQDKVAHGTDPKGERHGNAKLSEDKIREIFALRGTMKQREIAARFGVNEGAISRILSGKRWGWLDVGAKLEAST